MFEPTSLTETLANVMKPKNSPRPGQGNSIYRPGYQAYNPGGQAIQNAGDQELGMAYGNTFAQPFLSELRRRA